MWHISKDPPAKVGDARDLGLISESGRSTGGGIDNLLQYSCLETSMGRGAWWATVNGVTRVGHSVWATEHTRTDWPCLLVAPAPFTPLYEKGQAGQEKVSWGLPCRGAGTALMKDKQGLRFRTRGSRSERQGSTWSVAAGNWGNKRGSHPPPAKGGSARIWSILFFYNPSV